MNTADETLTAHSGTHVPSRMQPAIEDVVNEAVAEITGFDPNDPAYPAMLRRVVRDAGVMIAHEITNELCWKVRRLLSDPFQR